MIRYTTPTITLTIEDALVSGDVFVTFEQGRNRLTIEDAEVTLGNSDSTITLTLTQEQTAMFKTGFPISVQVNWIDGGVRTATDIATISALDNLLDEVIE